MAGFPGNLFIREAWRVRQVELLPVGDATQHRTLSLGKDAFGNSAFGLAALVAAAHGAQEIGTRGGQRLPAGAGDTGTAALAGDVQLGHEVLRLADADVWHHLAPRVKLGRRWPGPPASACDDWRA